jgi:uncharacterized protein YprB with RNaseH-like and TPR domain
MLMCYAYKWQGESKTHFVSRHDFKTYQEFVQSLADLLDSTDIKVAHNGISFDDKMSNRFFVVNGIKPPRPSKSIDTKREAKRHFRFESNTLDDLGDFLNVGRKEKITYAELEEEYLSDNCSKKTKNLMKKYNIQDIAILEKIYNIMLPYMSSHPNLADIYGVDGVCPKCLGTVRPYGSSPRRHGRVKAYICNDCGGRCNEATIKKEGRLVHGK